MSETPCACEGAAEEVHLNLLPGSGESQNNNNTNQVISGTVMSSCCNDNHRKLAIWSVICGISCIGIIALINSVKAQEVTDPELAINFSRRARKFGIISIVTWVAILVSVPALMTLISYILTLWD